jgi:hypothetical protein
MMNYVRLKRRFLLSFVDFGGFRESNKSLSVFNKRLLDENGDFRLGWNREEA